MEGIDLTTKQLKSIAYYKTLYVKRGKSGLFRDYASCEMAKQDALTTQQDLARRLASARPADNTK